MRAPLVILVVDDDEAVRLLLATLLERDGYTVLLARDGPDALEVSRKHAGGIGALVTDFHMPGMDGLTLARTLATERAGLQVMIMSGRLCEPEALSRAGFSWLPKPFTITLFRAGLERCLKGAAVPLGQPA